MSVSLVRCICIYYVARHLEVDERRKRRIQVHHSSLVLHHRRDRTIATTSFRGIPPVFHPQCFVVVYAHSHPLRSPTLAAYRFPKQTNDTFPYNDRRHGLLDTFHIQCGHRSYRSIDYPFHRTRSNRADHHSHVEIEASLVDFFLGPSSCCPQGESPHLFRSLPRQVSPRIDIHGNLNKRRVRSQSPSSVTFVFFMILTCHPPIYQDSHNQTNVDS